MALDVEVTEPGQPGIAFAFATTKPRWRAAHQRMLVIAKARAAFDAEEAELLIVLREAAVHRELGLGSFREYVERTLGHSARAARERIRVAERLAELPLLRAALARGTTSFSAVRELTRVATPENEEALIQETNGKTVREIEDLVAGHEPRPRRLTLELQPEVYAQFLEVKRQLQQETGSSLDDSAVMAALLTRRTGGTRPTHQVAVSVCKRCEVATVDAAGEVIAIDADALAMARCDATHVGRDGAVTIDVPRKVRRLVEQRDHHRCRVPGCRSSLGLHVHHLDERAKGGAHVAANLILLCPAHHDAVHRGRMRIVGTDAERLVFEHEDRRSYGASGMQATAKAALRELGYSPAEAGRAVTLACARSSPTDVEALIRAALRACLR